MMRSPILLVQPSTVQGIQGALAAFQSGQASLDQLANRIQALYAAPKISADLAAELGGIKELIEARLYHGVCPNGKTEQSFFQVDAGTSTLYSNLKTPNQLPWKESFKIKGIFCMVKPFIHIGTASIDALTELNSMLDGYWELKVGDTTYNEGTLWEIFKQIADIEIFRCQATAADAYDNIISMNAPGIGDNKPYFDIPNGPVLAKGQTFSVEVKWASSVSCQTSKYLYIYLIGKKLRPAAASAL